MVSLIITVLVALAILGFGLLLERRDDPMEDTTIIRHFGLGRTTKNAQRRRATGPRIPDNGRSRREPRLTRPVAHSAPKRPRDD
jgi:hypothetical protein